MCTHHASSAGAALPQCSPSQLRLWCSVTEAHLSRRNILHVSCREWSTQCLQFCGRRTTRWAGAGHASQGGGGLTNLVCGGVCVQIREAGGHHMYARMQTVQMWGTNQVNHWDQVLTLQKAEASSPLHCKGWGWRGASMLD